MKITTNHAPRDLVSLCDVPEKVAEDFDYITDRDTPRLFFYRGSWHDAHQFEAVKPERVPSHSPLVGWHGVQSDSYFSGLVARFPEDDCGAWDPERIIVGRYAE